MPSSPSHAAGSRRPGGAHARLREAIGKGWTRRRVVRIAKRLGLRPDEGLQSMVAHIERLRRRPIGIQVVPLPSPATGLTCFGEDRDTIVVNDAAEPLHRVLITLHELWHLIEDFVGPGPLARLWRESVTGPLERCRLRQPKKAEPAFGDHSVFDVDNLPDVLGALSPELVREVIAQRRPVKMRGEHNHAHDPAEVFARQMLQMIPLDEDRDGTGAITSSFAHRRTGI
ncbi:hypothetical protein ADK57_17695 [Streptomyces sp. MMG1533]|uniref:hypothetical protein n=1 Tax=Streptomyces sp. MMG1533 TaxID=1415546 RepID=UPI0006AE135E|nr:hypothetical protein [Streptomyces sp. MMG1533]KOU66818.1 hypothetical protein ADK57_17695 [Streptomyces sp. MMG1533]